MRSAAFTFVSALAIAALPAIAHASYSPPLSRVRIDRDTTTHTPSFLYATDQRAGQLLETNLHTYGAQYVLQIEWENGFGLQAGAAAAYADLDVTIGAPGGARFTASGKGYLLGAQLRVYAMLLSGDLFSAERASALTSFINLRAVYYSASGDASRPNLSTDTFDAHFYMVSAGAGFMAELALAEWVSICPYAWFSPGLNQETSYTLRDQPAVTERGSVSVQQPLRVGIDVWIYHFGKNSDAHFALSAIASLIDTKGQGNSETAFVLSYTF